MTVFKSKINFFPHSALFIGVAVLGLALQTSSTLAQKPAQSSDKTSHCLLSWETREGQMASVRPLLENSANLNKITPTQIQSVKTYIKADEALRFKCRNFSPPPIPNPLFK